MSFGRAGLYFWCELAGRLQLLGMRFRAVGGRSGLQKSQPEPSLLADAVGRKLGIPVRVEDKF